MGRTAGYSKRDYRFRMDPYIEGNVVHQPKRADYVPERRNEEQLKPSVSRETRRNRARARGINFGYVLFLLAAAVATVFVCVHFLQLQAENTSYRKRVGSLESQLSALKMENDAAYDAAVSSVVLEKVKDIAIHELGMVYADKGQIITYNSQDGDYVRQYDEVPKE
ncbi:MAG: hypothetical protein MRZ45_01685 [Blautia sp.]|nr:hypothetical protein [Blautia sp.]MDY4516669.1 hypothetical protein [Lachnospiraceae bacterium]